MAVKKMGFEGIAKYGVAGGTAATVISNSRDMSITLDTEKGDTTVRGTGSVPINTERVTGLGWSFEMTMLEKSDDTTLEALKVAAYAGTPVALRLLDYTAGKGYDGDVNVALSAGKPLKGEQTNQFTFTPNDDNRVPQLYV